MINTYLGFQKLTLNDFDYDMACTIFIKGCNFTCPFCHNRKLVLNNNENDMAYKDILSYLKKRKNVIRWVVITGGEPTTSLDLLTIIQDIKQLGYKIKLDTNGTNPSVLSQIINNQYVDYIAMDIKNSFNKYNEITGSLVDISKIKESIELISSSNINHEFRTTVVKEYHNDEDLIEIASYLKDFEKYFLQRFIYSEDCISSTELHPYTLDEIEAVYNKIKQFKTNVYLRGYDK